MNQIEFDQDLKLALHNKFKQYGIKIPIRSKVRDMLLDYLTVMKKLVKPIPRKVIYNPEFSDRLKEHSKEKEIRYLERLFVLGKNVNFYQSKRIFQTRFHDHLLYEWNIFHFHLGNELEKKSSFIKQTDQMLFVYVLEDTAVFLDTETHKNGIFGNIKWLEILHDHFPHLIEQYKDRTIRNVAPVLDAAERQLYWDKGLSPFLTKIRDAVYNSPGIGRTTSGHSILVVDKVNSIIRWLFKITEQFSSNAEIICDIFKLNRENSKFKIEFNSSTIDIIEVNSRKRLISYPNLYTFE